MSRLLQRNVGCCIILGNVFFDDKQGVTMAISDTDHYGTNAGKQTFSYIVFGFQCLSDFLDQCRHSSYHYVVCSHHLLKKPGGQLVSTLTGHNSVVDSLDLHQDPGGKLLALTGKEWIDFVLLLLKASLTIYINMCTPL